MSCGTGHAIADGNITNSILCNTRQEAKQTIIRVNPASAGYMRNSAAAELEPADSRLLTSRGHLDREAEQERFVSNEVSVSQARHDPISDRVYAIVGAGRGINGRLRNTESIQHIGQVVAARGVGCYRK